MDVTSGHYKCQWIREGEGVFLVSLSNQKGSHCQKGAVLGVPTKRGVSKRDSSPRALKKIWIRARITAHSWIAQSAGEDGKGTESRDA